MKLRLWDAKKWMLSLGLVLLLIGGQAESAAAFPQSPETPILDTGLVEEPPNGAPIYPRPNYPTGYRYLYLKNSPARHHWALIADSNHADDCDLFLPTDETPTEKDILGFCGMETYTLWNAQSECALTGDDACPQFSLVYFSPIDFPLPHAITLPGPVAYVKGGNCEPWGICQQRPMLTFAGSEPIQSYEISKVYVLFEGHEVVKCTELPCDLELPFTDEESIKVFYYAVSSYGDRSWARSFEMRNIRVNTDDYLFQLMGDPWWYQIPVGPAQWEVFPSLKFETLSWVQDVQSPAELYTQDDLSLLAGKLIQRGTVSAAGCEYGGLLENGAANACGNMSARDEVIEVQNQFNSQILDAAHISRVPPRILKGIVAQESQFYEGWVIWGEYGYGMITDQGADMLLTWNLPFYLDLCVPVYGEAACASGYSSLDDYPRAYLRGLALQKVGTDQEFVLLGQALAAAAGQAGQLVRNITSNSVGRVVNYDQMWMISLAVYHGGAGCVGTAITDAWAEHDRLTWPTISEYLPGDCQLIADYPDKVLGYSN